MSTNAERSYSLQNLGIRCQPSQHLEFRTLFCHKARLFGHFKVYGCAINMCFFLNTELSFLTPNATETLFCLLNINCDPQWPRQTGPRQLGRVKRICVFEHSAMTNFNCACPAIQRGQGSGVLSEGSSWLTACMSEQRRFWRDCADAKFAWRGPIHVLSCKCVDK